MSGTITVEAQLPIKIEKKGDWFIACCDVLELVTQGKTEKKAKANLGEAVTGFIATCVEMGTLESVLKDSGFTLQKPAKKAKHIQEELSVKIPLYCLNNFNSPKTCLA